MTEDNTQDNTDKVSKGTGKSAGNGSDQGVVIDLSAAREKREGAVDKASKAGVGRGFAPKGWNISYKRERWGSGDRSEKVSPNSAGNSGYVRSGLDAVKASKGRSGSSHQPFFNFGVIPGFSKYFALSLMVSYGLLGFALPADMAAGLKDHFAFTGFSGAGASYLAHVFVGGSLFSALVNAIMVAIFGTMIERAIGAKPMIALCLSAALVASLSFGAVQLIAPSGGILIGASCLISALFGFVLMQMQARMRSQVQTAKQQGLHLHPSLGANVHKGKLIFLIWIGVIAVAGLIAGDPTWISQLVCLGFGVGFYTAFERGLLRF